MSLKIRAPKTEIHVKLGQKRIWCALCYHYHLVRWQFIDQKHEYPRALTRCPKVGRKVWIALMIVKG